MGILVQDNGSRSRLQERIATDLREKVQSSSAKDVDFVDDSEYVGSLKKTSRFGWVWFALILMAVISVVVIIVI